jgi:zinc protease
MKKIYMIFALLIALVTSLPAADAVSFEVNGLRVIFRPNTANDIIAAGLYFRGGVSIITEDRAGIENFTLIAAQKGTKNFPKDVLNSKLEQMDSRISSSSGKDYSSLDLMCVKQNFKDTWAIFTDIVLNPLFDQEEVDLERQKIISGIEQSKDNPDSYQSDLADQIFYAGHAYAIPIDGTVQTVSSFTPGDLSSFLKGRLTTSQLLLVVVGNTTQEELEGMVKDSFGKLPKGDYKPVKPETVTHQEPSMMIVNRDIPTNYILGQFPAPGIGQSGRYAALLAGSILRDRMWEEVRTKRGLSYAPSAGTSSRFESFGYIYVTAVSPDTTIKVMINELNKIKNEPVTDKDLKDKVNQLITRTYMGMETNSAQVDRLATYELSGAGYKASEQFIKDLKSVTPDEIRKYCDENIKNLQYVLIGNPDTLSIKNFMY